MGNTSASLKNFQLDQKISFHIKLTLFTFSFIIFVNGKKQIFVLLLSPPFITVPFFTLIIFNSVDCKTCQKGTFERENPFIFTLFDKFQFFIRIVDINADSRDVSVAMIIDESMFQSFES